MAKQGHRGRVIAAVVLAHLVVYVASLDYVLALADDAPSHLELRFFSTTGVGLAELSGGAIGEGWLAYYTPEDGPSRSKLAVHLVHEADADAAWAYVYAASPGQSYVPWSVEAGAVLLDAEAVPVIEMQALGGWWVRDGVINYNLEVQVNGPVAAMWGAGYDPKYGATGWAAEMEPGEPAVKIRVADPDSDGICRSTRRGSAW